MRKVLFIGLEKDEVRDITQNLNIRTIHHELIPKLIVQDDKLFVEHPNIFDCMIQIDIVIFHGIFENDFDPINALAIWDGVCLPNPVALLNCRLKHPCLARALRITKFKMPHGFVVNGSINVKEESVAKWGNWHCGENKKRFTGEEHYPQPTVIEPFIKGTAVRILIIGNKSWQIQLKGDDWLKSIHHETSYINTSIDEELLEDTLNLKEHFQLEWIAVDYMVTDSGKRYMLEVNHIPNMDRFPEVREHYTSFIKNWIGEKLNNL
ncbi:hypothetical protein [Candidatus Uabimicrobium sp. HlEnr_7]|uniref:hypothetical protein n=1 Tax=Candidatus Uabimicrobium helgolandensis TaxID=3095367 RepID=UPI003557784D